MWHPGISILTPSSLDPLALGAGLAWAWQSDRSPTRFVQLCVLAAGLFVVDRAVAWGPGSEIVIAVTRLWIPLAFVGLVHAVSTGSDRAISTRPLTWRPVVHVGLISYGMYLFHPFIEQLLHRLAARLDVPLGDHGIVLTIVLAVTVPAATLSWYWFESPINRRKARHPYVRSASTTAPAASP